MVAIGSSFFTIPDRHPVLGGSDPELVVWLRGQHDSSTESALCMTLARAIALGAPGLVLDLAEVQVMSTSTLAVIARARVPPAAVSVFDRSVPLDRRPAPHRRLWHERPRQACGQRSGRRGGKSARSLGQVSPICPSRCPNAARAGRPRRAV